MTQAIVLLMPGWPDLYEVGIYDDEGKRTEKRTHLSEKQAFSLMNRRKVQVISYGVRVGSEIQIRPQRPTPLASPPLLSL